MNTERLSRLASVIVSAGGVFFLPLSQPSLAQTQPTVFDGSNSASYSKFVAQGSIFVVKGRSLGPAKLLTAPAYPLTPQLGGTSIRVVVAGVAVACPMFYTSASQVAAVLPSGTPVGDGMLTVTYNGATSFPSNIHVVNEYFGIYTVSASGIGPGIITGLDYVTKTLERPAKPGEVILAWGTGLGPVSGGDSIVPPPGAQFSNVEVFVGDRTAKVIYAGRSGCCAGLDQIAFEVPDAPESCFVPVSIRAGADSSNFVTLPLSRSGESCSNPMPGISLDLLSRAAKGDQLAVGLFGVGPVAVLQGARFSFSQGLADKLSVLLRVKVPESDIAKLIRAYRTRNMLVVRRILAKYAPQLKTADPRTKELIRAAVAGDQQGAGAKFGRTSGLSVIAPQLAASLPTPGVCTILRSVPADPTAKSRALDAGPTLTLDGPTGQKTMSRISNGEYQVVLPAGTSKTNTTPGLYTISGVGGKDIGVFSASLNISNVLTWTNKLAVADVDRSGPLTITWSGGPIPGYVIIGGAAQTASESPALFACTEETQKGTFTIPQFILSALPNGKRGTIFIAPHPLSNSISVPGLDLAFISDASTDSRTVSFR